LTVVVLPDPVIDMVSSSASKVTSMPVPAFSTYESPPVTVTVWLP
jgi:hypothetical protein